MFYVFIKIKPLQPFLIQKKLRWYEINYCWPFITAPSTSSDLRAKIVSTLNMSCAAACLLARKSTECLKIFYVMTDDKDEQLVENYMHHHPRFQRIGLAHIRFQLHNSFKPCNEIEREWEMLKFGRQFFFRTKEILW